MVEQLTFQTLFQFLQTVGILVGVFYYIITIRTNQRNQELALETRQAQLFSQYHLYFNDKAFAKDRLDIRNYWEWEDYEDFNRKYGTASRDLDLYSQWTSLLAYYEGLGVLVKRGLINIELVDDMMSGAITRYWEKHEGLIKEMREKANWPQIAEHIEYLYNHIKPIVMEQHPELKP